METPIGTSQVSPLPPLRWIPVQTPSLIHPQLSSLSHKHTTSSHLYLIHAHSALTSKHPSSPAHRAAPFGETFLSFLSPSARAIAAARMGILLPSIPNSTTLKETSARKEAQPDCLTYLLRQGREQVPQNPARSLPRLSSLPKELSPTTGTDSQSIAEKLARLAQVHSVRDVSWTDKTSYQPMTISHCHQDQTASKRSSWEGSPHEGSWDMQLRKEDGRRKPRRSSNGSLARSPRHRSLLHSAEIAESLISFLIGTPPSTREGLSRSRKNSLSSRR
jgi:hypothetical protein